MSSGHGDAKLFARVSHSPCFYSYSGVVIGSLVICGDRVVPTLLHWTGALYRVSPDYSSAQESMYPVEDGGHASHFSLQETPSSSVLQLLWLAIMNLSLTHRNRARLLSCEQSLPIQARKTRITPARRTPSRKSLQI